MCRLTGILVFLLLGYFSTNMVLATNEEQARATLQMAQEACFKQRPLSAEEKQLVQNKQIFNTDGPAPSANVKCFVRCLYNILGLIGDNNGVIEADFTRIMDMILKDKMESKDLLQKCPLVKGSDECDTVYNWAKCLGVELKAIGIATF